MSENWVTVHETPSYKQQFDVVSYPHRARLLLMDGTVITNAKETYDYLVKEHPEWSGDCRWSMDTITKT